MKKCADPENKKSRKHKNRKTQFKEVKEVEGMNRTIDRFMNERREIFLSFPYLYRSEWL